jgi:prepilin-type N-terminal cleavage/methylation domain-containing protein
MKSNKKGMTLVECIIAMAVFAVATTGFTMVATTCMKAQARTVKRMTTTNNQTTNLEHFSTFSQVLDPEYTNVKPMENGTNRFKMTFAFPALTVENDHVYGYTAKLDEESQDGVFELSFFSAADQVTLDANEYWITLYNYGTEQRTWDISCAIAGDSQQFEFFDNEKNNTVQQTLPRHIWAPNGGYMKFGIRPREGCSADGIDSCLKITCVETGETYTVPVTTMAITDDEPGMCAIYFNGTSFLSPAQFDSENPESESEE